MKKAALFLLILTGAFACKKSNDNANATAIVGTWRYTGSDSSVGPDLGDTLRFTATGTVYYTYLNSTTWSNYQVKGNQLILIGSAVNDSLTIQSISATQMQISVPELLITNWTFEKIAP